MPDPIDHTLTNEPVCPYCGHNHAGSWEWMIDDNSGEFECEECGKEFFCERVIDVSYTTAKIKETK